MKTIFAAVFALWTSAHADTASTCKPSGDAMLSIEHAVVSGVKKPTNVTKLYASGAWTFAETDADGKAGRTASGCLGKDDVAKIKTALDGGAWKITHPKAHCMAMAQTFTVFTAGAHTFTEKLCGNDLLDEATQKALDDADKLLASAAAPPKESALLQEVVTSSRRRRCPRA